METARVSIDALHRVSLAGTAAVVLGARAVKGLDPKRAFALLRPVQERVLLALESCPAAVTRDWVMVGFTQIVPRARVAESLRRFADGAPDCAVERSAWLPPASVRPEDFVFLIQALDRMRNPSVEQWAASIGWRRNRLVAFCNAHFGMSPRRLLQRRLLAQVRECRRRGVSTSRCAMLLGYSDGRSLRRAVQRAASADAGAPSAVDTVPGSSANGPR